MSASQPQLVQPTAEYIPIAPIRPALAQSQTRLATPYALEKLPLDSFPVSAEVFPAFGRDEF